MLHRVRDQLTLPDRYGRIHHEAPGMSTWRRCERARAQAMSSATRMSSQRYIPYYLAIRREAQRKVPAQRGQTIILRREPFSQPGVNYRARKSALT